MRNYIDPRQPSFDVEYDKGGKRVRKAFDDYYAGRRFYIAKDNAGKNPKVKKPLTTTA